MTKKIKGKGKTFIISKGEVLERSNNRYKIKQKVGENDKSDWFPVSMITSETRAEEIKRKQKAKMNIARKKNTKQDVNGKMNFPSTPGNSQKISSTKIRIACLTKIKFSEMKKTFSTTFAKQLLKKMRKRLRQRPKKKKTSSFQTCKNNLEKEI